MEGALMARCQERAQMPAGQVPLRAEDALFLYAQTPLLCQQVGAVLLLECDSLDPAAFRAAMRERIAALPELRRRLERPASRWRRARWVADGGDVADRIAAVTIGEDDGPAALGKVIDEYFSVPCDPFASPWEMALVQGVQDLVMVKVHHTMGDSDAIIAALARLFDRTASSPAAAIATGQPGRGSGPGSPSARRAIAGLWHLAAAGRAPALSVCGPFTGPGRRYIPIALQARAVATAARRLRVGITDLLLAMIAEALDRVLRLRGEETEGLAVRIAVPRSSGTRSPHDLRSSANKSAVVSLDLPLGSLPLYERLASVRGQIEAHQRRGEPEAASLVLRTLNCLPPPLQRRAASRLYRDRWFNMIVSVFPGDRRGHHLVGARVGHVYPVLALADGVGLAIGAMTWEKSLCIGILADAALVPDVDRLASELTDAFGRTGVGEDGQHPRNRWAVAGWTGRPKAG